jgi:hypothetical protein
LGRGRGAGPREGRRREPKKEKKGKEEGRAAEQAGWAGAAAGPPREMGERMAGGGFSFYLFIYLFFPSFCSFLKTRFSFEIKFNHAS